jgi:hypothetical protein
MTHALRLVRPARSIWTALLILAGALLAVGLAASIGNPTPIGSLLLGLVGGVTVVGWILYRPYHGFLLLAGTAFFLIVYAVTVDRYINAADVVFPVLGVASWFGVARRQARTEDARLAGPEHAGLRRLTHDLARAGIVFYLLVFVSIGWLTINVGPREGLEMVMFIARSLEGAALFPLGIWWLRSEKRIYQTIGAACVAGALFTAVNLHQVFVMGTFRAGMTWIFNHPEWPVEAANEAGFTMLLLWVLILARHHVRPSFWTFPALAVTLLMLFLTQSRSSLLGLILFTLLSLRRIRWQYLVAAAILVPLALRFVPEDFFHRMTRSVTWQEGTFEVYSMLIRVYGYQSAFRAFLDNWFFGVGFFGLVFVSQHYNDLQITDLGAENIFLETAAGMGVVGLAAVAWFYWHLLRVGIRVRRVCPPGTLGHVLGGFHLPYVLSVSFIALTGDSLIGLTGLGQLMLWTAMVIRAGHLAVEAKRAAPGFQGDA